MVTLRIEPHLSTALRASFEAAANEDAPIHRELLDRVRTALTEATVTALPSLPLLVTLASPDELYALSACFEVGGECHPGMTDDQWNAIQAVIDQAT